MTTTHTLGEGGDLLTFDVHGELSSGTPLLLFGSPMDAGGFATLASHFTDRPVVTLDPRGAGRNPTGTADVSAAQHAADLHRVIEALGVGPVDAFGSSGGAVNLLALLGEHPDDVRTAVAHEPPTAAYLPDREAVLAVVADFKQTYAARGDGAAMAKFIALVIHQGEVPADWTDGPAPDPATFGLSGEDDGVRTSPLFRNAPSCNVFETADSLRDLGGRVVIGVGLDSGDAIAARGGRAVAAHLGLPVTDFPGDHGGFLGGEFGQTGKPDEFAARLRDVLDGAR